MLEAVAAEEADVDDLPLWSASLSREDAVVAGVYEVAAELADLSNESEKDGVVVGVGRGETAGVEPRVAAMELGELERLVEAVLAPGVLMVGRSTASAGLSCVGIDIAGFVCYA